MNNTNEKKNIYSAIQASGIPSLGNYLGALKNWVKIQNEFNSIFCIADLHSITVRQSHDELQQRSRMMFLLLLAIGLDPDKSIIYFQSHVSAHCELMWILNCYTQIGELNRMTQFKDKSKKHSDNINAGLYTYPVLMAADILLYNTNFVPVGVDQKQHVEISRDIAIRFNNIYGDCFIIPEAYINDVGAKIMNLQSPDKKMSKSDSDNGTISLFDSSEIIKSKISKAKTDSGSEILFNEDKAGVSNLLSIFSAAKEIDIVAAEKFFKNKSYRDLKEQVAQEIINLLQPIQKRFNELKSEKNYVDKLIVKGAHKASIVANAKLKEVKEKIGFISIVCD
jgi:tryptophanyl-tRNA synthetase